MEEARTLLVVDDDLAMREMLVSLFEERGFSVDQAASADEALERLGDVRCHRRARATRDGRCQRLARAIGCVRWQSC